MDIQKAIENSVQSERFSLKNLSDYISNEITKDNLFSIKKLEKSSNFIINSLIRFCFLIEIIYDDKAKSTRTETRWCNLLKNDNRYSNYDECLRMFKFLLKKIEQFDENDIEILFEFKNHRLLSWEIPCDYIIHEKTKNIHNSENVKWILDNEIQETIKIRAILYKQKNESSLTEDQKSTFKKIYENKIRSNVYLTGRSLTGEHKTNREKRWESHTSSVQFALRRECLKIEKVLLNQIFYFDNFPMDIFNILQNENVIHKVKTNENLTRCPITLDAIDYNDFEIEIKNPTHGKSNFQIGHLNPLKSGDNKSISGHSRENISWISVDGNRIQGNSSLDETRKKIIHIYDNYRKFLKSLFKEKS